MPLKIISYTHASVIIKIIKINVSTMTDFNKRDDELIIIIKVYDWNHNTFVISACARVHFTTALS